MTKTIELAISTCPNDTFAFHGLLTGQVDSRGLDFRVELHDVQELNRALFEGRYDCAKASFHAGLLLSHELVVFSSGSALGFGVGPLLLAAADYDASRVSHPAVLCPGEHTTATMLYKLFYPGVGDIRQVVFSEIMPALQQGTADLGVCIHEGRFTWQRQGLQRVADLGTLWEERTNTPLPLGGIVGRRALGNETLAKIQAVIHDSVRYGLQHRAETLPTMKRYAQELEEEVIYAHVDLYVNDWTVALGEVGQQALDRLHTLALAAGMVPEGQEKLEIITGEPASAASSKTDQSVHKTANLPRHS